MMKVIKSYGNPQLATLFVAQLHNPKYTKPDIIEFVEARQPPIPKIKKWVLIISTMAGCPVKCKFCDAGFYYHRKLTTDEMFAQIDYMITTPYPNRSVPVDILKIHFARMGEPSLNAHVLDVLKELPIRYQAPGIFPSISSVAPASSGTLQWYHGLKEIKDKLYGAHFQMQFSIHTTDEVTRRQLIPIKSFSLPEISKIGESLTSSGDRKITLNFALMKDIAVDPAIIARIFNPDIFFIKMTPLNPTRKATTSNLQSSITESDLTHAHLLREKFNQYGFEAKLAWGESEENMLQTNCGQMASRAPLHF